MEYKKLKDVCKITKGVQFNKINMNKKGSYPVINGGVVPSGYIESYNENENTITIAQGGSAGFVNFQTNKFWAGAHCYIVKPFSTIMNKYLYHYIKNNENKLKEYTYGVTILALAKADIENIEIPIPEIHIQKKISNILDKFEEKIKRLLFLLKKEKELRQKQYEYYRNILLEFNEEVEYKKLKDVCDLITSGTTPKIYTDKGIAFIKTENVKNGILKIDKLKYISKETQSKLMKRSILKNNDILFSIAGTIGETLYITEDMLPANTNQNFSIIRLNSSQLPKYVLYCLQSDRTNQYIKQNARGSAQLIINLQQMKNIEIPTPDLDKQEKIIYILDKFSTLYNSITKGLPAEILKRQKQYEYYRNLLFEF